MNAPRTSLFDRFDQRIRNAVVYRRGTPTARRRELPDEPTREPELRARRAVRVVAVLLAVALPVVVAAGLVPFRSGVEAGTAALVLVLPVVLVASVGGVVPGAIAAGVAALAFDVLLTRPYYRVTIDAAADIELAIALAIVGTVVGQLVARELDARSVATLRRGEVEALLRATGALTFRASDDLEAAVQNGITAVLRLRSCRWAPGYHGTVGSVLGRDGSVGGVHRDRAVLPGEQVELPVVLQGRELGRLVLRPTPGVVVSREERLVAVAMADLLAAGSSDEPRRSG